METKNEVQEDVTNQIYEHAANLMFNENKSATETKQALVAQGLDENIAVVVITNLEQQMKEAKKKKAEKDMLYGALWCIGGTVATVADFGYVFWGAIVFGGIQFIMGVVGYAK